MIFEVKDGGFGYFRNGNILAEINFTVQPGEVLSVLGPNGVGKTTLLKCMMGLLHWHSGATFIDGRDIRSMSARELWKKIAYVPQAKASAFSYKTEEMVLLGRNSHIGIFSQPSVEDNLRVEEAMETVGISYLRGKECGRISGGELQMVLIARALAGEPSLLVLDEPESNLDFKNQLIILEKLEELSKKKGISSIFNTHYPAHALRISDNSLILTKKGRSIFGKTKEIVNCENMRDCFSVNVHIDNICINNCTHSMVLPLSIV